jgi:kynurenine formamidase
MPPEEGVVAMTKEAWGRWGECDERGAVNLIDLPKVKGAAHLVREGRVISLAQPLSPDTPTPKHRTPMIHLMGRDGGDYAAGGKRPGGFQFAEDTMVVPMHFGTHIDALCHAWYDDRLFNGFSGNTIRSTTAATRCGIDKMGPIVTRGVLLDLVRVNGAPLTPGTAIGMSGIRSALDAAGAELCSGDAVLLRTGWLESVLGASDIDFNAEPGIDVEAAKYLAEAGAAMIGADNFAVEVLPFPSGKVFPVHQRLIRDYGIPLMEGVMLKPLAEAGATVFCLMAAPLPIVGGTGSPLAPIAIL